MPGWKLQNCLPTLGCTLATVCLLGFPRGDHVGEHTPWLQT